MDNVGIDSLKSELIFLLKPHALDVPLPSRLPFLSLNDRICSLEDLFKTRKVVSQSKRHERQCLETEIEEAVCEAKCGIKYYYSGRDGPRLVQDLKKVIEKLDSIIERFELDNTECIVESQTNRISPDPTGRVPNLLKDKKIVGLEQDLKKLAEDLTGRPSNLTVITIFGMAGIGKSTLASILYDDPFIVDFFEIRTWVTISVGDHVRDVMLRLLDCILQEKNGDSIIDRDQSSDADIEKLVYSNLEGLRYFVVFDGVWEENAWENYKGLFPENDNCCKIILTTQLKGVANYGGNDLDIHEMQLLDASESWDLLRDKVFGKEECSRALEKIGRKIAKNCQGLPLAIIITGEHLAKAEKTPEYWESVAASRNSVISASEEGVRLRTSLLLSYRLLPEYLKPYFLYTGIFQRHSVFRASKLINLWVAEGFFEPNATSYPRNCLQELVDRSVVLVQEKSSTGRRIKTCILHYVFWEICSEEAGREKFFGILNRYNDIPPIMCSPMQRLIIHNNVLLGIEDVRDLINGSQSTICSVLCVGPYHPYPLNQVYFCSFLSLKILDAVTIRFYLFPTDIMELLQLRYLALSYGGGEVPREVFNRLRKLQVLIILQPFPMKRIGAVSYLPMEIWEMQELKHLHVMGFYLPLPDSNSGGSLSKLPCLSTLILDVDVDANSRCSISFKEILEKLPNLVKFEIWMNFTVQDISVPPMFPFDHLRHLRHLKSFKLVVDNRTSRSQVLSMPPLRKPFHVFPQFLTKLTLSGCGLPWEDMKEIGRLRFLESLKVRCNAFQGPVWEVKEREFRFLRFLLLEDLNLRVWRMEDDAFNRLQHLKISHCYKFEFFPDELRHPSLRLIEVDDCNTFLASRIECLPLLFESQHIEVRIHRSWNQKSPAL